MLRMTDSGGCEEDLAEARYIIEALVLFIPGAHQRAKTWLQENPNDYPPQDEELG